MQGLLLPEHLAHLPRDVPETADGSADPRPEAPAEQDATKASRPSGHDQGAACCNREDRGPAGGEPFRGRPLVMSRWADRKSLSLSGPKNSMVMSQAERSRPALAWSRMPVVTARRTRHHLGREATSAGCRCWAVRLRDSHAEKSEIHWR